MLSARLPRFQFGRIRAELVRFGSFTAYVYGWYALPMVLIGLALFYWIKGLGIDFDANVWRPGQAVLHGNSPYPQPELSALVGHTTFLYPPPLLLLDAPLALFPHVVARGLFWVATAAAVLAALHIVGVRDRRVYFVASLAFPVWYAEVFGNPTLLLLVPLALAWRHRDEPWAVGVAVGCIVALKLILWPLGLWLLATRRIKATGIAVATSLIAIFGTWALIGFKGLADYPRLLRMFSETTAGPRGFTLSTLGRQLGLGSGLAHGLQWACGVALLALVVVLARRIEGDRRSFSIAIAAALVITPVVEEKYLALLLVPLALARPSFGLSWRLVRWGWIFPLVPRGDYPVIEDHGRQLVSLGRMPSIPQLLVVLTFLGLVAYATGRAAGSRAAPGLEPEFATLPGVSPPSSRGLGRRPLTAETGVRIPVAVLPDVRTLLRRRHRRRWAS
jgi:hypothetical protein